MVDEGLPEPDLFGLGDIDSWWFANGYPTAHPWIWVCSSLSSASLVRAFARLSLHPHSWCDAREE
ncbi:hypothetical protein GA0115240_180313 [Streptomyces sp. DvalAA-14]|nr:hypothetical protein GA0115240_180313 [Streptomyces sp. DvalAA-14]